MTLGLYDKVCRLAIYLFIPAKIVFCAEFEQIHFA